jgi:hypothetical protein
MYRPALALPSVLKRGVSRWPAGHRLPFPKCRRCRSLTLLPRQCVKRARERAFAAADTHTESAVQAALAEETRINELAAVKVRRRLGA